MCATPADSPRRLFNYSCLSTRAARPSDGSHRPVESWREAPRLVGAKCLKSLRRDAQRQPHQSAAVGRTGDAEYGADEVCLLLKSDQSKVAGLRGCRVKSHAVVFDLQLQLSGIAAAQRDAALGRG